MKLKTFTLIVLICALSCSSDNVTGKVPGINAAYSSSDDLISTLRGKAETPAQYFMLAGAYEKKRQYKAALLHYANSCFSSHRNMSLRLFPHPVYRHVTGFHFKSPFYDDAVLQIASIFKRYREYSYVLKFIEKIDDDNMPLYRESLELKIKTLTRLKKYTEALKETEKAIDLFEEPSLQARFYIRQASLYEKLKQYAAAKKAYLWIIKNHPDSWQEGVAVRRLLTAQESSSLEFTSGEKELLGKGLYNAREYKSSWLILSTLVQRGKLKDYSALLKSAARSRKYKDAEKILSSGKSSNSSHLAYAEELWAMGQETRAFQQYRKLLKLKSPPEKTRILYQCGKYHEDRRNSRFIEYFARMLRHDPAARYAGETLWLTGRHYLRHGDHNNAARFMEESILRAPKGKHSDQCRFWLSRIYSNKGEGKKAWKHLVKMAVYNPDSTYTWRILPEQAKALSLSSARAEFQKAVSSEDEETSLFYHSVLSLKEQTEKMRTRRLKKLSSQQINQYQELESLIRDGSKLPSEISEYLDIYLAVSFRKGIKRTVNALLRTDIPREHIYAALCEAALKHENYFTSLYYLQLLMKEKKLKENFFLQSTAVNMAFLPRPFRQCIIKNSRRFKVSEAQLYAVIKAESLFNHRAISPAGATGLMQLMPATGRGIARELGIRRYDLKVPCTSIKMGAHYIAWLNRFFKNNFDLVVAGYNAGAGNVKKWQKKITTPGKDYFAEFVPFAETRYYIFRTNKYIHQYALLYDK